MCLSVFVGSNFQLPLVPWNEQAPGFHLNEATDKPSVSVKKILKTPYLYEAGSHMGCACGFAYGDWSRHSKTEQHAQRVKDVRDFAAYLNDHKRDNALVLFCTWWERFPDGYESLEFNAQAIDDEEFDFEEDMILMVK